MDDYDLGHELFLHQHMAAICIIKERQFGAGVKSNVYITICRLDMGLFRREQIYRIDV